MKKLWMVLFALSLLTGCSSPAPKTEQKPQPKEPETLTARSALQKVFIAARGWGRDAQPFRIESQLSSDGTGKEGKSAVWRVGFASEAQRGVKPYIWSGSEDPNAPPRGINPGTEDTYNPNNASTHQFDMAFLKIDSSQALETALKHGGDKILAKEADTPIQYVCDWSVATNELIWHVSFGASRDQAKLTVAVNATSGDFIRVEK
ncbi:MAG: hypothetical protein JST79_01485 [Acidobacteria bacterium]|nr:hypothetical protein [Acidobacteriota bacterium]